jgi:hypothetical protein
MPGPDLFHEVFPYYAPFFLGFILVVFFVWISILYLIGSVFGGEGTIPLIGKLVGYYTAPLILVSLPLGLVEVGKYFLVLIGIFFVYLTVLTVKITHQHNWAKAIIVCLISLLIACPAMARVIGRPFLF